MHTHGEKQDTEIGETALWLKALAGQSRGPELGSQHAHKEPGIQPKPVTPTLR